ncbi:increased loss of mitochondrial DNA protein 1 [Xylaria bambusicola]|uniref:increased loss of mitochondrial DNA protein 1 n=1 Tax=Xylaria bambusicola TaxID=326684 RepID=UPI002007C1E9|nr:increased loss of mitochondrial DNA protein 1 [Xylaria bambusicola]KAI0523906.1 increased loss of mitochondrial DNA protein 1 [Xylaria bambusicola]
MALISASTILTSLCLFHITLAYFFYTNPQTIADQALVYVLGEATGMPQTQYFSTPSPTASFLAVILFVLGLSDLITLSMPQEIWLVHYWGSQAPARIILFAALTLFTYTTAPSTLSVSSARAYGTASGSEGLRNRVFFAFSLLECISWFWAWVTLREETAAFTARKRRRSGSYVRERS